MSYGMNLSHEADLLVLNRNDYLTEVEIKVTHYDLKKEEHKRKHRYMESHGTIRYFLYAMPENVYNLALQKGTWIPDNAGILVFNKDVISYPRTVREPVVNRTARKINMEEKFKMARLGCFRYWNLMEKHDI